MSFISYSQNFEDVLLWRALRHLERGTYLDIGAQDPVQDSVSLAFYNAGWRGTHVEPTPYYAERLRKARSDEAVIQAAVSCCAGPIEFHEFPETGLSTGCSAIAQRHVKHGFAHRPLRVPTVRLANLLEQIGEVQWLKIDVEGMEADVLLSWDDQPVRPWVLVIEATAPNSQEETHHEWQQLVTGRDYTEVHFDGLSRFFVHSAHQELAEQLRASANVFDAFNITERHFAARLVVERAALESVKAQERNVALAEQASKAELRLQALEQERADADAEYAQLTQALQDAHAGAAAAESSAERFAVEHLAALQALAAAETDHRRSVDQFAAALQRAQAELLETTRARVADQHDQQRVALEAQQNLRNAECWRRAAEVAEAELEREKLRWEKKEQTTQVELGIVRAQLEEQKRASADEHTSLQEEIARLQQMEQQVVELTATVSLLQQRAFDGHKVIASALEQLSSRWQRLGRALGLAQDDAARAALRSWLTSPTSPVIGPEELEMNIAPATEARNPYQRAHSLPELLSYYDVDFVRCAYVTMLGRQPDPEGEVYYTERMRRGVAKLSILRQIRSSKEGRDFDPGIADLDAELAKFARVGWPIVGKFLPDSEAEPQRWTVRTFRSLANQLGFVAANIDRLSRQVSDLRAYIEQVQSDVHAISVQHSSLVTIEDIFTMFEGRHSE